MLDVRATLDKLLEAEAQRQLRGGSGFTVGTVVQYAGSFPPDGWVVCDGRTLSRTVYEELFDSIGTTYGSGDGSTTFNIPDFRNRFPVSAGDLYNLNDTGGNKDSIIPYHRHSVDELTSGGPSNNTTAGPSNNTSGGPSNNTSGGPSNNNSGGMSGNNPHRHGGYGESYSGADWQFSNDIGAGSRGFNVWNGVGNTNIAHTHTLSSHTHSLQSHTHSLQSHTHGMQSHTHSVPSHSTSYVGASGNITNANLPPYIGTNFIIFTGVYQTVANLTTWTSLADRITNSKLNIAIPTFFDDPVTIDDDIKIKINQNATTGVDRDLNAALANLGWSDLISSSTITFKGLLSRMARGGAIAGTIMEYAGTVPPDGWVVCDGRALSRTVYEELFDAIGTTYGSGDGSTTFNIPDMRGRVATGVGTCDGVTYALGEQKNAGVPNITGSTKWLSSNTVWSGAVDGAFRSYQGGGPTITNVGTSGTAAGYRFVFDASGSNSHYGASTTIQPNTTVINYIIFTGVYQTMAVTQTWTSLQDRISNSQLNIPVVTNFGDTVNFQGNNFSFTNAAAFRNALGVSQTGGYAFQRYTGDTTLSTAGQTKSFSVTITTHGRPVVIIATSTWNGSGAGYWSSIYISRGSTVLQQATMVSSTSSYNVPGAVMALETLAAGTYTYTCTLYLGSGGGSFSENNGGRSEAPSLVAFEI